MDDFVAQGEGHFSQVTARQRTRGTERFDWRAWRRSNKTRVVTDRAPEFMKYLFAVLHELSLGGRKISWRRRQRAHEPGKRHDIIAEWLVWMRLVMRVLWINIVLRIR